MGPSSFSAISFSSSVAWTSDRPPGGTSFRMRRSRSLGSPAHRPASTRAWGPAPSPAQLRVPAAASHRQAGRLAAVPPVCVCMRQFSQRCLCDIFPKFQLLGIDGRNGTQSDLLCKDSITLALPVFQVHIISTCKKNVLQYSIAKPNLKSKHTEDAK